MRIFVTGSNGFIGKHVVSYLKKCGCYVIGLGTKEDSSANTDEYISCDLGDEKLVQKCEGCFSDKKIDAVVHLAADMRNSPYTEEVVFHNCVGTERIIQLCRKINVPVFVELSSLPVIGSPKTHPITEDHSLDPYTTYHVTKVAEEMLAEYAAKAYGIRTASLRISAPVGIGMNKKTIFPTFIRNALNNEPLQIYGKGTREQTYIHVKDISQAIYRAIVSPQCQGVYNLSSYNRISNYELAKKIIKITKSNSEVLFNNKEDKEDSFVWDVCIEKIIRDTGYKPVCTIEYAIEEYANYVKEGNEK